MSLEHPIENVAGRFSYQLQGLCHDQDSVFIVQRYHVWKISKSQLARLKNVRTDEVIDTGIPKKLAGRGFNHMGECDVDGNRLLIPLEGGSPLKLLVLDTKTLNMIAAPDVPASQKSMGWVAVDRRDHSLLIGEFMFDQTTPQIRRVRISQDWSRLDEVESFSLLDKDGKEPLQIDRVQAVEIDRSRNKLHLLSDVADGGVLKFDLNKHTLEEKFPIPFHPPKEEIEGLDILEQGEAGPYPFAGQIFVLMNHKTFFGIDGRVNIFSLEP